MANRKGSVTVMITKAEWDVLYRRQLAEGQERFAPGPTFEEVEALSAGRLSGADADRVRELLSYYPELLRVLTEPLPSGGEGVLTDAQVAADLASIRERVRRLPAHVPEIQRNRPGFRVFAIAASIVIAVTLGGLGVWLAWRPRTVQMVTAYPDITRGGDVRGTPTVAPVHLSRKADYILSPVFEVQKHYHEYRLELLDLATTPPRRVWIRNRVAQQPDATYPVRLSTRELDPGLYRLVLYGVDGTVEQLAEYTLRLREE